MSLQMSKTEREAFLASLHVGILAVSDAGGGAPLAVPIWYTYEAGEVRFVTGGDSRKARLLRRAGRFSLCVQTETAPYAYVSVEGPIVSTDPADVERDVRPLAHRYLGLQGGDRYVQATIAELQGTILVRMRPERWWTVDYSKMPELF